MRFLTSSKRGDGLIVPALAPGVSALLLGDETRKLLTHAKIPVLVYR